MITTTTEEQLLPFYDCIPLRFAYLIIIQRFEERQSSVIRLQNTLGKKKKVVKIASWIIPLEIIIWPPLAKSHLSPLFSEVVMIDNGLLNCLIPLQFCAVKTIIPFFHSNNRSHTFVRLAAMRESWWTIIKESSRVISNEHSPRKRLENGRIKQSISFFFMPIIYIHFATYLR